MPWANESRKAREDEMSFAPSLFDDRDIPDYGRWRSAQRRDENFGPFVKPGIEELTMKRLILAFSVFAVGVGQAWAAEGPAMVDAERMKTADGDGANWPSYGRTYS